MAVIVLIGLFLTPLPRELSALAVAGFLLLSRKLSSREMIGAADWHLLLLFVCLFGVTAAFAKTGLAQEGLKELADHVCGPLGPGIVAIGWGMAPVGFLERRPGFGGDSGVVVRSKMAADLGGGRSGKDSGI